MTDVKTWRPSFTSCDDYLAERTGLYEHHAVRYRKAADWLVSQGLSDDDTICDVGAGWTEFDYCLRKEYDWRGRYIPVDGGISNVDLNVWVPERDADFFVALEIVEHLYDPLRLISAMKSHARKGVILSTPNPETVDVLGMDATHVIEVTREMLHKADLRVSDELLYGGVFSHGEQDAFIASWVAQ